MSNDTYTNPWPFEGGNYDKSIQGTIQSDLPLAEKHFLYAIGPFQTTINILLYKLINELKRNGLDTVADKDDMRSFIANLTISDGRSATSKSLPESNGRDDGGRVKVKGKRDKKTS